MQHTLGPWKVKIDGDSIWKRWDPLVTSGLPEGRDLCIASTFYLVEINPREVEANAFLIAAAPDLYEALLALMDAVRIDAMREAALGHVLATCFAALRKAGGVVDGSL